MRLVIALLVLLLTPVSPVSPVRPAAGSEENGTGPVGFAGGNGPVIFWTGGVGTMSRLREAGVSDLAVPVAELAEWKRAGFEAVGIDAAELSRRRKVATPKLAGRGNVASATRRPWIDANGWVFTRYATDAFLYDELPSGKASLAAAEAYAYGVNALLRIAPDDLSSAAATIDYLRRLPAASLPVVADFTVVDNNSPQIDEVLNLLTRRNLLYRLVPAPIGSYPVNIRLGTTEYPESAAADPSAFAQQIRLRIGDENRSLRVYGSEVIIARLTGDGTRGRVHLLNYSGRVAEGLRIRVRGNYRAGSISTLGHDGQALEEPLAEKGVYEGTIPKMGAYAVVDLR